MKIKLKTLIDALDVITHCNHIGVINPECMPQELIDRAKSAMTALDVAVNQAQADVEVEIAPNEDMFYVAQDPKQPGAAWAVVVDKPDGKKYTAEAVSEWILDGAVIRYVEREKAVEMMAAWKRPNVEVTK